MEELHNMINGVKVPLTQEEIADFKKREADHATALQNYLQNEKYKDDREIKYIDRGLTPQAMIVALWERVVEGKPESSDALQIIRESVKSDIPAPIKS